MHISYLTHFTLAVFHFQSPKQRLWYAASHDIPTITMGLKTITLRKHINEQTAHPGANTHIQIRTEENTVASTVLRVNAAGINKRQR